MDIVQRARGLESLEMLAFVNRSVNAALQYETDQQQWGVADKWSVAIDREGRGSFQTGRGDCEDFAIAKYAALLEAGFRQDDLRIILARELATGQDHALLAARVGDEWKIFDNRSNKPTDPQGASLVPLISLAHQGANLLAFHYSGSRHTETASR